jgi:glycosyltransferase involved in cell wall biosynthesis
MKILYCNKFNFRFGGTEAHLLEVMDLMRSNGHQVALFSTAHPGAPKTEFDRYLLPAIDFKSRNHGPLERLQLAGHVVYSFEARRRLRQMIEDFRPDIAHVRGIYHQLSPAILWELRAHGIPVLYHINDFKVLCPNYNLVAHGKPCERCCTGAFWHVITEGCHAGPPGAALTLAAESYVHRWLGTYEKCVDLVLAPSRFVAEKLTEHGWRTAIEVLPHFQTLPDEPVPDILADAPMLYFGRLSREKGVADVLHAMKLAPQLRLRIAGDGPERQELENLARDLQLQNVDFLGHKNGGELGELIGSSAFTIFPSRAYEILGKSILESYAWGRAVVASDLGSRREFVCEGETGLLYPPGDAARMAEAISALSQRPHMAARMGANGRALVADQHAPGKYFSRLMQIYESLRRKRSTPSATVGVVKPRLRIAFIGGRGVISGYSGIETCYEEAGKRLAAMGYEITVYCRNNFTPAQPVHEGMRLVRFPAFRSKNFETAIHTFLSTLHVMMSRCDIVHYHALGPALFSFLPRLVGKKAVVTVQGLDWQRKKWGRIAAAVLRAGEWASAHFPNSTVVVSQTLREHYRRRHGLVPTYVPNGTVIRRSRDPLRVSKWGIEPGKYILYAGRFSPEKNCELLIAAYNKIETSVKLVLAGATAPPDAYTQSLRRQQSDKVRVLDWVSGIDLDELLANAILFVLPSDLEGLSLSLLDAMGAGVCVLASDIPENCEAVGDAGHVFRHGDVLSLEEELGRLIHDRRARHAAGALAQQRVREHYLWPKIAAEMESVYYKLLEQKPGSTAISKSARMKETRQAA